MIYSELRAFHAVASHGSFTKAAIALNLTQPTLSNQVKALEERHGVVLFDRRWRRVVPTELGQQLLDLTRRIVGLEAEAEELLSASAKLLRGRLRIGTDSPNTVVPMLNRYSRLHPGITLALSVGNTEMVLRDLFDFEIDLAVTANIATDLRLHAVAIRRDPMIFFVASDHPWSARDRVPIEDITGQRLIVREPGSITRDLTAAALAAAGVRPASTIEVEGREAAREVAAAGIAVGVMSAADFVPDPRLAAVPIEGAGTDLTEYLVCLQDRARQRLILSFLNANEAAPGGAG